MIEIINNINRIVSFWYRSVNRGVSNAKSKEFKAIQWKIKFSKYEFYTKCFSPILIGFLWLNMYKDLLSSSIRITFLALFFLLIIPESAKSYLRDLKITGFNLSTAIYFAFSCTFVFKLLSIIRLTPNCLSVLFLVSSCLSYLSSSHSSTICSSSTALYWLLPFLLILLFDFLICYSLSPPSN